MTAIISLSFAFDKQQLVLFKIEHVLKPAIKCHTQQCSKIDDDHCNPKKLWQELGAPQNLTPAQVTEIKEKSKLRAEKAEFFIRDGKTVLPCTLQTNDIVLFTAELEERA